MVGWRGAWSKQARSQTSLIARNDVSRTAEPRQRGEAIPGRSLRSESDHVAEGATERRSRMDSEATSRSGRERAESGP